MPRAQGASFTFAWAAANRAAYAALHSHAEQWEATMRIYGAVGAALLLVCGAAQANEASLAPQPDGNVMAVGIGVICNTTAEAEQYVKLRSGGAELTMAVNKVNAQAQDPKACGVAAVAFLRDETVGKATLNGKQISIVRINVVGGYNGREWARIPAMVQYAVMEDAEAGISI
jgi:hypothetical protein